MMALLRDENGSTLTEYGVLMFSLAITSVGIMISVSNTANNVLSSILSGTTTMELCPPGTTGCPGSGS
jgi:Flp pilus assembly pilin Flp